MILTIEVMLTVVVPLVLGGILDQGDIGQRDLAHTVHQVQPPSLGPVPHTQRVV